MSTLFQTKTIAERQVSSEIIEALLSTKEYLEQKSFIYIQDEINNESNFQVTLVISDMEDGNNDNLILKLGDKIDSCFLGEIIELISSCKSARDNNFDNLNIYN